MIELIEQFSLSKFGTEQPSEDRLVFADHIVAVVDGASSHPRHPASAFQKLLDDAAGCIARIGPATSLVEVTATLSRLFHDHGISPAEGGLFFSIYNGHKSEIWSLGDCQAIVDGKLMMAPVPSEALVTAARKSFLVAAHTMAVDTAMETAVATAERMLMTVLLQLQKRLANQDQHQVGYGVINGCPVPSRFFRVKAVGRSSEIVLATDGYPRLEGSLAASEAHLQRLLTIDRHCIQENAGPKGCGDDQISYDDRAYIRFRLV